MSEPTRDELEKGPNYAPDADLAPHATWDRYGNVCIHVGSFSRYLTPLEAASLAEQLELCADAASEFRPLRERSGRMR